MKKLLKKIYTGSVILTLFANSLVPAMVYAQENSQNIATATVGLAQNGKVKVTTANTTGEDPQYTTARRQGTISLDGSRLEQPVTGGYIEIKYPVDYIESFSISTGSPVVKTDNSTPGVLKVYLSDITQTTSASLPFSFKFKDRVTPEGYSFTPEISLKSSTGETLSPTLNDLKYTVKVDKQSLFKYDGPNDLQDYTIDNRELYGGSATNGGITEPSDIPFKFSLSTNTNGGGQTQNWGNGRAQTRAVKTITVTDTLPVYTKVDGSTGTAVFDPAKNPGWTLNADGTVSTTVTGGDELTPFNTEAENALRKLTLLLSFPDAKVKTNIVNNVKTELSFVNQSDTEENLTLNDGIQFKLVGQLISDGGSRKSNNDSSILKVDEGAPDSAVATWNLLFTNTAPNAISELTMIDDTLDSRMYYYAVGMPQNPAPFDYDVYGVKADNTEVLLGSVEKGSRKQVIVDQEAYDAITNQAKQIYAGTLDKANASRVNRTYQSIKIKLKDGKTIPPFEKSTVYVQTKLLNPFDETERENPIRYENSFHAEGLVDGFGQNGKFVTKTNSSVENLRYIEETIQLIKSTRSNPQGTLGEVVQYNVTTKFDGLSKSRRINGGKIIDVLPEGITYEKYYIHKQEQKNMLKKEPYVIENYNGSGRQALVFELKDLDFYNDKTIDAEFSPLIYAKITSNALPTSIQNPDDYKKNTDNHAYFTAKDFSPLPGKVKSPSLVDNVFKVANVDGTVSDKIIGAKSKTLVDTPTEIRSEKFISTSDGTWTKDKVLTDYDQEFKYLLKTKNYSITPIKTFTLYDRLPYTGDEKGSNFTPFLTKALEVDPKFTVYYNTAKDLSSDPYTATQADGWIKADVVTDFTKVTAIKVVLNEGETIAPGEIVGFVLNMKNPSYTDGSIDTLVANNSFYTNRDASNPKALGETNVVSNQLPQYIPVEKKWVGDRDASVSKIKVELFKTSDPSKVLSTLELNETNDWKGIFKLTTDGKLLDPSVNDYAVREVLEEQYGQDYTTTISGDALGNDGVTITNTRNTVSHTVTKVWKDNDNKLSLRKGIKVQLKQNGKNYGMPIELNEDNQWTYTFNELPDSLNGVKYEYSVDEVEVPEGYDYSISNEGTKTVITNTILDSIKKDLSFKKELQGRTLQEGEFTFNLLDEKGNVVQTATNGADGTIQFTNLLFEKPGTYIFKVKEVSGTDSRITYDNSEKEVTVVVTQEGKALVADIQYGKDNTFTNVYTEPTTTTTTTTTEEPTTTTSTTTTTEEPTTTTSTTTTTEEPTTTTSTTTTTEEPTTTTSTTTTTTEEPTTTTSTTTTTEEPTTTTSTTTTTTEEPTTTTSTTTTTEEPTTTTSTTTTTEEPTTTTSTTTTTEEPTTTTSTTTTTEEPTTTTSTTTTSEEPSTSSTTTTTTSEEPSTSSTTTTTTSEEPSTSSTTTTTSEEPSTTSTTTTTTSEEPSTSSTTTTTSEEPSTTSTTTTTSEEPSTSSTTTTTTSEEPSTSSTTTTTSEEPSTSSTTTTTSEEPSTTSTTTTTTSEEPSTSSTTTTTTSEDSSATSPTEETTVPAPSETTTTEDKPGLPNTGEATGAALVFAGVVILAGTVIMKRKFSK